jgi:RNA polymerase sigma-70 factor (ECF subfamily)
LDIDMTPSPAERWLDDHGDALYRYALLHLADESVAEDIVQDTLLAALKAHERFEGRSSERTWLIGILKRKLIDHIRKCQRRPTEADLSEADESVDEQFNRHGLWATGPGKWGDLPEEAFSQGEFWDVMTKCLGYLPERLRFAFIRREMDDAESAEICQDLDVSATNLWTLLHRARTRLRRCLEVNWFRKDS